MEKEKLEKIRGLADEILDTSQFNVHELRETIRNKYQSHASNESIVVTLKSFGYKYGIPYDSDLLFDVRFLPNPYFIQELKNRNGNDREVIEYLTMIPDTGRFLSEVKRYLDYLLPLYIREGKSYLTISIGCTGGRHRSVFIANELKKLLQGEHVNITVTHRDIAKE